MAITKTHPIKATLKAAIDYICNPAKTDGKLLVSSFGCTSETADIEFEWTRRHAIDKGTNLGRHLIQAFAPGEVSPEEAHEIGMELAKEILDGKYEFVLTTHIDRGHIHNHVIWNAVSFTDYKHYHSNKRSKRGAGLQHWAKLQNLKQAAKTLNFITEHGIDTYEALENKLAALTDQRDSNLASIKAVEGRIAELTLIAKYADTYQKCRPIYDRYKQSGDKEKYLRGHESEIILFEAAARELKQLGAVPLPSMDRVQAELAELTARKNTLYADYSEAKRQIREYETIRQNLDILVPAHREQEQ